ncbi:MAG: hypothetical protein JXB18_13105 [Sedimentisphaerales bacterium]|nr:hypothetical protein [Sedimentisphaerales bacterium]
MIAHMRRTRDVEGKVIAPGWIEEFYHTTPGDREIMQALPIVTDAEAINNIQDGVLKKYVEISHALNCPVDKVKTAFDGTEKFVTYATVVQRGDKSGLLSK